MYHVDSITIHTNLVVGRFELDVLSNYVDHEYPELAKFTTEGRMPREIGKAELRLDTDRLYAERTRPQYHLVCFSECVRLYKLARAVS